MPPVGVGASHFTSALETGIAKLWVLLIGIDRYQDDTLPSLQYAATDCQGIAAALATATDLFPQKEFLIHHDLVAETPTLENVAASLRRVVTTAKAQDTVLIYFSGHGIVEPISLETVLCLSDTDCHQLARTGLPIQAVLDLLGNCAAHSQLLWLDACHSGNLNLINNQERRQRIEDRTIFNPTTQLVASLSQRAVKSRGFYALLSCDEGQQSWEFPDLGHGVFSYYLMLGLQGEAADAEGIIDADGLYRYVYRQTIQFINHTNQQIRSMNQSQRERGEMSYTNEYSLQTPKRIVSGVGEIVLGIQPQAAPALPDRRALIIDGSGDDTQPNLALDALSQVLQQEGKFTLDYVVATGSIESSQEQIQARIQGFLGGAGEAAALSTRLLYLRGQIVPAGGDDDWLKMGADVKLSCTWLCQQLASSPYQQILLLDCLGTISPWTAQLKLTPDRCQCVVACATSADDSELFTQVLLETLISAPPQLGISGASLCPRLETSLGQLGLNYQLWLSAAGSSMAIVPRSVTSGVESIALPEPGSESGTAPNTTFEQEDTVQQSASVETFTASLTSMLYQIVGPIAPTLITKASQHLQTIDPATVVKNLIPLLPTQSRASFEQQATTLLKQPQSSSASAKTVAPITVPQKYFSPAQKHEITATLRRSIGPIAGVLLGKLPPAAWADDRSLLAALKPYLSVDRLATFTQYLQPAIPEATTQEQSCAPEIPPPAFPQAVNGGRGSGIEAPIEIDDVVMSICERELMISIGPISKFIVASTRKKNPHGSVLEFIAALTRHIPDRDRAALFGDRVTAALGNRD